MKERQGQLPLWLFEIQGYSGRGPPLREEGVRSSSTPGPDIEEVQWNANPLASQVTINFLMPQSKMGRELHSLPTL